LPERPGDLANLRECPGCGAPLQVLVFPALVRPVQTGAGAPGIAAEGEASCFYHAQKRAVVPCDGCGRFLCALCDMELNGQHLCPGCFETGRKKGRLSNLDNRRTLHDSLALTLTLLPLLFYPATLLTAPAAVYVCIRYWNAPGSLVRRARYRFVLAMILALLQMTGWVILFWSLFRG
jgi:hypothetical protein